MNPSRIGVPVNKTIDEWHFRFNGKVVRFNVALIRPRDAQSGEHGTPNIKFQADCNQSDLEKAGIDLKVFARARLESHDINELRKKCEEHIHSMLKLEWKEIIIVGFHPKSTDDTLEELRRRDAAISLKFDYTLAQQAGHYFRRWNDGDDSVNYFMTKPWELLGSYSWDPDTVHVMPYSESLHNTFRRVKVKYAELNARVAYLLKPANIASLVENLNRLLPESTTPPPSEPISHEQQ